MGDAAKVIDWNGTDLPTELRLLPPGRYRLAMVAEHDEPAPLSDRSDAPTAEEIARATEGARREDGSVDAFALALALAVPMRGAVRSDDRAFRFTGDEQMLPLMRDDG